MMKHWLINASIMFWSVELFFFWYSRKRLKTFMHLWTNALNIVWVNFQYLWFLLSKGPQNQTFLSPVQFSVSYSSMSWSFWDIGCRVFFIFSVIMKLDSLGERNKIGPTWNCSQQVLWIMLRNWVMISGTKGCWWVFQKYFYVALSTTSDVPSSSVILGRRQTSLPSISQKTGCISKTMDKRKIEYFWCGCEALLKNTPLQPPPQSLFGWGIWASE